MEEICLEIIAGLRDPFEEWGTFFPWPKPTRLPEESVFAYRHRLSKMVKKEATVWIARKLRGEL